MIRFGIYPEIRGGRGSKLRKCLKLCSKTWFLEFSGSILESKRRFGIRMVKWEMFLPFKDKGKDSPSKPWEIWHFSSFLPYFSTCPFLKSGRPTPIKIIFSELTRTDLLLDKVEGFELENCRLRRHLKLGDF